MRYASFDNLGDAIAFRKERGGWIFYTTSGEPEAIWFNPVFTATPIMLHPATHGKKGILV